MFKSAPDAAELPQPFGHRLGVQAGGRTDGDRGQSVADVIGSESGSSKVPIDALSRRTPKRRRCRGGLEIVGLPVAAVRQAECLHPAARLRLQGERVGIVGAQQQEPTAGHEIHEPPEGQPDRIEVRIDVGVIELDVVDDRDVRQVLQELRRLVEECAVVLVAFDHEVAAAADPVAVSKFSAIPPMNTLGSAPPCASSQPVSEVVVVLPWVPVMTIERDAHRK